MDLINRKCGPRLLTNRRQYNLAVLELFCASVLWGASFTLVRWGLVDFSTSTLVFWRFLVAFVLGETFFYLFYREEFKASHSDILRSMPAGFFLAASIILQTEGLITTSATSSSFITSLYVIFVPLLGGLFYKQKIMFHHFILGLTGLFGMGLLMNFQNLSHFKFSYGDLLTLGCAIAAAFHIITVGRVSRMARSSFRFNNYQTFWTLIIILPFLLYETTQNSVSLWPAKLGARALFSVLGLAVFVSILGFYLQIRAQKVLNTTTSSLLCLLEAPNAFVFATIFLAEKINAVQKLGILLILLSSVFSVFIDRPKNRHHQDAGSS